MCTQVARNESAAVALTRKYPRGKEDEPMQRSICCLLCLAGLFSILGSGAAQAQQPSALVIEGGTLIDGNGGTPIPDAVVIIQGDKITSVSRKGQANYPANSQIIKADGKFILPGLWDA